ncbi:hypothetical protein [Thermomonospora umbrina]|uniref:DUF3558 domain-containing protein n=1 Tax=Thermomonospora umbrina TaxID=111806 RepID=A0A3D9SX97_9ACTN|nr:hypothetical protein [Thermomonospora umbrina]REE98673.1 hypothetical protein DFJ69_4166 [Thermomonospora umbrina]
MGLSRSSGDFDRIYSPPEPPETARRSRRRTVVAAGVAVAAVASLAFLLFRTGDDSGGATVPGTSSGGPGASGTSGGAVEPVYRSLPPACRSVSPETVRRVAPGGRPEMSGNDTLSYCAYGSRTPTAGGEYRWLEIDARLYPSGTGGTAIDSARRHFGIKWTLAGKVTEERTVTLERRSGLGDQAFHWFKTDRRLPLVTGQIAVRSRNVVITVSYSERTAGEKGLAAQRERCLDEVAAVTREVLRHLR